MRILILSLLLAGAAPQENPCAPDCPTRLVHPQSTNHTHGGKCRACAKETDVCFAYCEACAKAKEICPCGGKSHKTVVWKNSKCGVDEKSAHRLMNQADFRREWNKSGIGEENPKVDFEKQMVVAIFRGSIHESAATRVKSFVEFDDRLELTYAYTSPKCGNEERLTECVFVVVPRSTKKLVVRALDERSDGGMRTVATFEAVK